MSCMGSLLGCFGKRRQTEAFLQSVREGQLATAIERISEQPDVAKSTTLLDKKNALHLAAEVRREIVLLSVEP